MNRNQVKEVHGQTESNDEIDMLLADPASTSQLQERDQSTVNELREQLNTIAEQLAKPLPPDPHQNEAALTRAAELVDQIPKEAKAGHDKNVGTSPAKTLESRDSSELGKVGPYELLKILGQGGMGAVYKALHPKLDKIVALKVLTPGRLKSSDAINRFEREMKAVGKLDHPHLIRALVAGEADGAHYLVMEFVNGTDLSALIKQHGRLPIAESCELIIQAAAGLQAAHSRGMVHRDIKPANLMLAQQEFGPPVVKVLDLGLALLADADPVEAGGLTSDGQIMGTIDYMAPEQAQDSHSVDIRADIYSLGATLYALLAGGSFFQTRPHLSLMQKLTALATEPVPPIRELRGDVSDSLALVIHRMLAKKPGDRYATPADVIAALKPFAAGANLEKLGGASTVTASASPTNVDSYGETVILVSDQNIEPPKFTSTTTSKGIPSRRPLAIAAAAIAGAVLLAVALLTLRTPHGEVIVEIPDDLPADVRKEIKISVTGDGAAEVANEANGWKVGIKEGKYGVELTGGQDRVQIEDKQVTVSRNKKAIVTIRLKPLGEMAANPNSDKPASPGRQFAEWLKTIPQITFDVMLATGGDYRVGPEQSLPENMSSVRAVFLEGPVLDQPGHAFAEEFAKRVKGTTLHFLQVGSPTLTTEQASRFLQLPEMADLRTVSLGSDEIDDGIVESLARLKKLTHLSLRCSKITGKGLSQLRELMSLAFNGTVNVTVEGFEEFGQLSKLTHLQIGHCPFTERHVEAISKLKLDNLETYDAGITDAVLKRLTSINTLTSLALTKSPITDADLQELKKLKSLATLHLTETKVTAAGVADLQKALPNCNILWDEPDPERRATEWLLSLKHPPKLDLGKDGNPWLTLQPGQALPADKFHLYFIQFDKPEHEALGDEFVDELAKHLSGSKQLARCQFPGRKLTAAGLAKLVRLPELERVSPRTSASLG